MDKAGAAAAFLPAATHALTYFPVVPDEVALVSLAENVTFRVTDRNDGSRYVLRLHRPWYHSLEELVAERAWVRALGDYGIAVPVSIQARDGRDYVQVPVGSGSELRYAGMTRWTEGELLSERLQHVDDEVVLRRWFRELGAIEATLHNQASSWQAPAGLVRHALDSDGLMGEAPFWGRFWENPILSDAERRLVLQTREMIRDLLDRYGRHPATFSLIHADLHPRNVLVDGDRLTVIDFDDCGFGWHMYDIAVALLHSRTGEHGPLAEASFVEGYRTRRDLSDEALTWLPMFRLIRGMALLGWYHQRPEIENSAFLQEIKAFVCEQCTSGRWRPS